MERINVIVSDEAKQILMDYKEAGKIASQDNALNALLLEFKKIKGAKQE